MCRPALGVVAGVDGRQAAAVAVQDEPGERVAAGRVGACLEVDEVPGVERGPPPADEPRPRAERELLPLARFEEKVVEAVERRVGRLGGATKPSPAPSGTVRSGAAVVADDDDARLLRAADPLSGRLRDARRRPRPRPRRGRAAGRCGGATAGSPRSGGTRPPRWWRGTSGSAAGTSGSAATTSIPVGGERVRDGDQAPRRGADPSAPSATGPRGTYALAPGMNGQGRTRASVRPPSSSTRKRGCQPLLLGGAPPRPATGRRGRPAPRRSRRPSRRARPPWPPGSAFRCPRGVQSAAP